MHRRKKMLMMQRQSRIRHAAGGCCGDPAAMIAAQHHPRHLAARDHGVSVHADRQVRCERINVYDDVLCYSGGDDGRVGVYIAAQPLTADNNYFEIEILDSGFFGAISVGLVPARYPLHRQPGWNADSVAYHADDGKLFKANGHGRPFGAKCHTGDKMGCGIKFGQALSGYGDRCHQKIVPVFFTRNGKEIGTVLSPMPADGLFPAIGMHSEGEELRLSLDTVWPDQEVMSMSVDNADEEWSRMYDVRLNGQLLEYTGRGKSIIDVGLAQSRWPLDTTYHYFEIEIVDPGENCYIAIGLARRDYPKHRHPGWNKGSIAYHADDGKIFIGSGVGDPFGPKCQRGDIMGCGILFPRDYKAEVDSDGTSSHEDSSPDSPESPADELLEPEAAFSSASEDEEWWERPHADSGTKVKVFFTRNGKVIGCRDVRIPRGGFYPTVGMLSSDEKVKVDLRPLTG